MPTDAKTWTKWMIETGRIPDSEGYYHYNPDALKDPIAYLCKIQKEEE